MDFKKMAREIQSIEKCKLGHAYDILARSMGFKDWNTMSAFYKIRRF